MASAGENATSFAAPPHSLLLRSEQGHSLYLSQKHEGKVGGGEPLTFPPMLCAAA